jgi:hypothetical protein
MQNITMWAEKNHSTNMPSAKQKAASGITSETPIGENEGAKIQKDFETRAEKEVLGENNHASTEVDKGESAESVRFHTEADAEADAITEWFNELENKGKDKGSAPRFQTVTPNLPNQKKDPFFVHASKKRMRLQDDALLVRRLEEELQKRGSKIAKEKSIYEQIDQVAPRVHGKVEKMKRELYEPLFKTIAEIDKIKYTDADGKTRRVEYSDVGRYLIALHAPERNAYLKANKKVDDGSGVTDADAAQMVADFEGKVPKHLTDELKKQIAAIRKFCSAKG